jgi:DNA polymerase-3 subunit chi
VTTVDFHFNVPDKVGYACRLLRKACAAGARLAVTGPDEILRDLDRQLWVFSPLDFVAHSHPGSSTGVVQASPVQLLHEPALAPHRDVVLNLGTEKPVGFNEFARLIELVSTDETDRLHARQRWRRYQEQGLEIVRYDVAAKTA